LKWEKNNLQVAIEIFNELWKDIMRVVCDIVSTIYFTTNPEEENSDEEDGHTAPRSIKGRRRESPSQFVEGDVGGKGRRCVTAPAHPP
jgi:hypothetical protein